MPFAYHLWSRHLVSDFDLGEIEPASDSNCSNAISIHRASDTGWPKPEGRPRLEDRFDNGDVWFASWRLNAGYLIGFPGLCSFRILPTEMRIDCVPEPAASDSTIAHLVLDHAIPRLLSLTPGFIVFHACAVQIDDQVIAVLGQSGRGKSTIAGWFASQGFPLLTDDCLVMRCDEAAGQWLAQPSYHSVRLWPDSVEALGIRDSELREFAGYSEKKRTGREVNFRFALTGAPLTACFVLSDPAIPVHSGPPELRPLSVNDAFLAITGAVFRTDPENVEVNRREFEVLTSLTNSVRFWSLEYERQYHWLPSVQEVMIKAIQKEAEDPRERHALYEPR